MYVLVLHIYVDGRRRRRDGIQNTMKNSKPCEVKCPVSGDSVREGGQGSEYRMMSHNTSQRQLSPSQRNAAKHSTAKFFLHGRVIGL